jgi:hypothetical protein
LLAGLASLLDHEMIRVAFYDPLDPWVFVPGYHDEAVTLAQHTFVMRGHQFDRLEA